MSDDVNTDFLQEWGETIAPTLDFMHRQLLSAFDSVQLNNSSPSSIKELDQQLLRYIDFLENIRLDMGTATLRPATQQDLNSLLARIEALELAIKPSIST